MPSLSVHLRNPDDHFRLQFHPSCPVCRRDRLAGSLNGDEVLSRRTQAVIATGLIAFSGVGVPVAAASEPDTVSEGTAEPVDSADQGSFDIGADTVVLPDEPTAVPEAPMAPTVDEDTAPLEQESEIEAAEPVVEAPDDVPPAPTEAEPVAETQTPPPIVPAPAAPPPAETPTVSTTSEEGEIRADASQRRERPATTTIKTTRVAAEPAPAPAPAPAAPVAAPAPAAAPAPTATRVVAGTSTSAGRAAPGDRMHVVRRGESLWSIAGDVLGERASVARIAREVNRLWELNEDSIASGDPNLLFAGTRLRLR